MLHDNPTDFGEEGGRFVRAGPRIQAGNLGRRRICQSERWSDPALADRDMPEFLYGADSGVVPLLCRRSFETQSGLVRLSVGHLRSWQPGGLPVSRNRHRAGAEARQTDDRSHAPGIVALWIIGNRPNTGDGSLSHHWL